MIQVIEQNLFENNAEAYFQCCNCFCRMRSGVAAGMRQLYPEAVEVDEQTIPGDKTKLGKFTVAHAKNGRYIYNLYGQYNYGTDVSRKVNYEALYTAIEYALDDCVNKGIKTIALPYNMGCGLARGNWNIVSVMIQELFQKYPDVELYICKNVS
jgi:O-acetyl-ADP-ribose deacetylase (regulator of RNase III)